jgi:hypothetical protein
MTFAKRFQWDFICTGRGMLFNETYQQALAQPKGKGWAHAGPASIQAALAQALGMKFCLNPKAIYDYANRHDTSLWENRKKLEQPDLLLVAVLNDWTLDRTEHELKG